MKYIIEKKSKKKSSITIGRCRPSLLLNLDKTSRWNRYFLDIQSIKSNNTTIKIESMVNNTRYYIKLSFSNVRENKKVKDYLLRKMNYEGKKRKP